MKRKLKVYIIGEMDKDNLSESSKKFTDAQKMLIRNGYDAINPFDVFMFRKAPADVFTRMNISKLIECDAAFILPCANLTKSNIEIKLVMELKMLILHDVAVFENSD